MKTLLAACTLFSIAMTVIPADAAEQAAAPRVVNVTSQSAPGWLPSEELERQALDAANSYFSVSDSGNHDRAYAMMSGNMKGMISREEFSSHERAFHAASGPVIKRQIIKVTWTKDPPEPVPRGVYAAIDIAARFHNVDRYCGYVIMHQPRDGAEFEVMRAESNFIPNAQFDAIAAQKSLAEANALWAQLAANCPNYEAAAN